MLTHMPTHLPLPHASVILSSRRPPPPSHMASSIASTPPILISPSARLHATLSLCVAPAVSFFPFVLPTSRRPIPPPPSHPPSLFPFSHSPFLPFPFFPFSFSRPPLPFFPSSPAPSSLPLPPSPCSRISERVRANYAQHALTSPVLGFPIGACMQLAMFFASYRSQKKCPGGQSARPSGFRLGQASHADPRSPLRASAPVNA